MAREINNELTGRLIEAVCELWGMTRAELVGRSRKRPLPWARAMLCDALERYAGHTNVSCAAILKFSEASVTSYKYQYQHNLRTYTLFNKKNAEYEATAKELWKQCKEAKK